MPQNCYREACWKEICLNPANSEGPWSQERDPNCHHPIKAWNRPTANVIALESCADPHLLSTACPRKEWRTPLNRRSFMESHTVEKLTGQKASRIQTNMQATSKSSNHFTLLLVVRFKKEQVTQLALQILPSLQIGDAQLHGVCHQLSYEYSHSEEASCMKEIRRLLFETGRVSTLFKAPLRIRPCLLQRDSDGTTGTKYCYWTFKELELNE